MPSILPAEKPRLSSTELRSRLAPFAIDRTRYPVVVVGLRGYYRDSMGAPGVNDRGIYDDAIFVESSQVTIAYNANTDPSRYRAGSGRGATKGMASLTCGAWYVHKFDKHKGEYLALCQRAGEVVVLRDGQPPYEDRGLFGINIHRGSYTGTSSEGCQTIHPTQWESFISVTSDQVKRYFGASWQRQVVPYVLMTA
jgi:lysozyme